MNIGIIGKGKMGRDIFNYLIQFDYSIVLICRKLEDIQGIYASIYKQLRKMLRRGYITDLEYEKKKNSFLVSNDMNTLKDCDIVIESVFEDKELKANLFKTIESIVKPDCILATNTSSIPLNNIFEKCNKKSRCMGTHFFFPVKVSKFVEINKTRFTEEMYVEKVRDLLTNIDKTSIELEEEANMILTKMLLNVITFVYCIYEKKYLSIEEIDKVLKEQLVTYGIFEVIDSTGINIIMSSIENFINDRYRKLYTPFYNKGKQLLKEGYSGGPGNKGLSDYEKEYLVEFKSIAETELNFYKENIVLQLQSFIINELAYIVEKQNVNKKLLNEAVQEVFGLSEDSISTLKHIGNEKIKECLLELYESSIDNIYQPAELSSLNNF